MKKNNLKSLTIKKQLVSSLQESINGGDVSRTAGVPLGGKTTKPKPCYSDNGAHSCGWVCAAGPSYTYTWSES